MMSLEQQYLNLKTEILEEAGIFIRLEQIKEHFAAAINSRRALSRIRSLSCIIGLLEERDLLNSRNVNCLHKIGELLNSDKIKQFVHCYKKLYLDGIEEPCICGASATFQQDSILTSQLQENQNLVQNNNQINQDLIEALHNVSLRCGKNWLHIALELGISLGNIDKIRAKDPRNYEKQAKAAFKLWLDQNKENASIEFLDRALNSRLCERKGLGSFLRNPF